MKKETTEEREKRRKERKEERERKRKERKERLEKMKKERKEEPQVRVLAKPPRKEEEALEAALRKDQELDAERLATFLQERSVLRTSRNSMPDFSKPIILEETVTKVPKPSKNREEDEERITYAPKKIEEEQKYHIEPATPTGHAQIRNYEIFDPSQGIRTKDPEKQTLHTTYVSQEGTRKVEYDYMPRAKRREELENDPRELSKNANKQNFTKLRGQSI